MCWTVFFFIFFLLLIIISAWSHLIQTGSRYWSNWDDGSLILSLYLYIPLLPSLLQKYLFLSFLLPDLKICFFILFYSPCIPLSLHLFPIQPWSSLLLYFLSLPTHIHPPSILPLHTFFYTTITIATTSAYREGINSIFLLSNSTLWYFYDLSERRLSTSPYLPAPHTTTDTPPSKQRQRTLRDCIQGEGYAEPPLNNNKRYNLLSLPSATTENLAKQNDTFLLVPLNRLRFVLLTG